ncbi:MAG: protein DpdD [Amaricoccus sp.]|uniref:protein DpdD n=1 Tax=Amaricoccus sp. TaxID=1872485 RepID=UPI0033155AE6
MGLSVERDALAAAAGWDHSPTEAQALLRTIDAAWFPGAVFPARDADGALVFYAAVSTPAEWRKLQPLLVAFVGPTLTDFAGAPQRLDPTRPVEQALLAAGVTDAARLRPGRFPQGEQAALRALLRLVALLEGAPVLAMARPEPTARLLAMLQDALNAGDITEAWRIHGLLREESRLEAVNLLQLEMKILSDSSDWGAVRWHDRFETLALAGPSPAIAEVLLEAIYWTTAYDPSEGQERSREQVLADPAVEFARLLLPGAPETTKPAVQRLRNLLSPAPSDEPRSEVGLTGAATAEVPAEAPFPPEEVPPEETWAEAPLDPAERARAAFLTVAGMPPEGNAAADANLIEALAVLSDEARADLLRRPMNLAVWQEVTERSGEYRPPQDWSEWVDALAREDFDAIEVAARGATAWRLADQDLDPAVARALAARIEAIPYGLAEERFGAAIPYLVQWAQSDPRWPRQSLCSFYLAILVRMALSARRGETALRSAAGLLEGALRCGLALAEYRDALDAAEDICVEGLSRTSAYDALEIVEIVRGVTPADADHLQAFSVNVVSVLAGLASRLTEGQRLALGALAREAGVELGLTEAVAQPEPLAGPSLSGKILGIYTLTEAAGRQAEALLRAAIPGLVVDLNHDHGGSAALAAMVARADLVVVAWASAKHAATEFIKARRGGRPLTYAAGKGATSILRAVEEWSAGAAQRHAA